MEALTVSYSSHDWAQLTKDWNITMYVISPITSEPLDMPSVTLPNTSIEQSGWKVTEERIPLEDVLMDAERQKLELDITREFEFADGEANRLIDERE